MAEIEIFTFYVCITQKLLRAAVSSSVLVGASKLGAVGRTSIRHNTPPKRNSGETVEQILLSWKVRRGFRQAGTGGGS